MPSTCELKAINSDRSLSRRDLTGHLFTLRYRGRVGERPLCRRQIKSKNARASQTKGRWPDGKGDSSGSLDCTCKSNIEQHRDVTLREIYLLIETSNLDWLAVCSEIQLNENHPWQKIPVSSPISIILITSPDLFKRFTFN